jgi:hypothetical protein
VDVSPINWILIPSTALNSIGIDCIHSLNRILNRIWKQKIKLIANLFIFIAIIFWSGVVYEGGCTYPHDLTAYSSRLKIEVGSQTDF